jgi:hypothetical protein
LCISAHSVRACCFATTRAVKILRLGPPDIKFSFAVRYARERENQSCRKLHVQRFTGHAVHPSRRRTNSYTFFFSCRPVGRRRRSSGMPGWSPSSAQSTPNFPGSSTSIWASTRKLLRD